MDWILEDEIISEYEYLLRNKLPHRVAFFSKRSTHYPFNSKVYQETVVPWLRKHVGKGNITWRHGYISKVVRGYWDHYNNYWLLEPPPIPEINHDVVENLIWGDSFYFLNEEDAILFKLTWG